MSFEVKLSKRFLKDVKSLIKKYHSFAKDFEELVGSLENSPDMGVPLGRSCYKIRLSIKSKGKGKSGGARVMYRSDEPILYSWTFWHVG
jgi:mRNA-degrading endonuclease RelE of RelBE toxin-antitoxin system